MKLWILEPVSRLSKYDNPWEPWFDKCFGFVICAETEEEARKIASLNGRDEIRKDLYSHIEGDAWLNPKYSTCKLLKPGDKAEVVMSDVHSA